MLELADIIRAAGDEYRGQNGSRMLPSHHRTLRDIEDCRTAALGGHVYRCDRCAHERYSYHSCRNRHCPKCEGDATKRWLASLRERLLTSDYFFLTFTLPAALRPVAYANQKLVYGALLRCAAQAVLKLTGDERHLGAQPGILAVLHTWTQLLTYHVHAHLLVTAGGLTAGGDTWRFTRNRKWLVPGFALADVFRGKMRSALQQAGLLSLVPSHAWTRRRWVVDCKHAGDGVRVAEYLARYARRVAITNSRLEKFENGRVTFRYQDRKARCQRFETVTDQVSWDGSFCTFFREGSRRSATTTDSSAHAPPRAANSPGSSSSPLEPRRPQHPRRQRWLTPMPTLSMLRARSTGVNRPVRTASLAGCDAWRHFRV